MKVIKGFAENQHTHPNRGGKYGKAGINHITVRTYPAVHQIKSQECDKKSNTADNDRQPVVGQVVCKFTMIGQQGCRNKHDQTNKNRCRHIQIWIGRYRSGPLSVNKNRVSKRRNPGKNKYFRHR